MCSAGVHTAPMHYGVVVGVSMTTAVSTVWLLAVMLLLPMHRYVYFHFIFVQSMHSAIFVYRTACRYRPEWVDHKRCKSIIDRRGRTTEWDIDFCMWQLIISWMIVGFKHARVIWLFRKNIVLFNPAISAVLNSSLSSVEFFLTSRRLSPRINEFIKQQWKPHHGPYYILD